MPSSKLVFGCGYLGSRVADRWSLSNGKPAVVTRWAARALGLGARGFNAIIADINRPESLRDLPPAETVLFAVGFDRSAGGDIHSVYAGGLTNVLAALPASVKQVIYISSTGVYGPAEGEWVDELTPPDPQRDGGRASLGAEQILAAHPLGARSAILRLAGIYGPGRVPHLDKLVAGEPLPVPSDGWLNLIHVDDAARIVVAADDWLAARDALPGVETDGPHIFCVSDGAPVRRADYYAEAARVLGAPPPRFTAPPPESPAAARAASNRRVRNDKLRTTLNVELAYPTYREGLAAILAAEE